MTTRQLLAIRLHNLQIVATKHKTPYDIVSHLGAMQAQDYPGVKWSIGLRLSGSTEADIERAISSGEIVRSWPMRGTLHFMAPEDVRWMSALLTPRIIAQLAGRYRQLELDDATLKKGCELLIAALEGKKHRTRPELMQIFEDHGIVTKDQRGYLILSYAAMTGLVCVGPMHGKQQTFVLLDEWVPKAPVIERDEALAHIALRYFTGHGPATLKDFVWWTGLTMTDARRAHTMVQSKLCPVAVDGQEFWMARDVETPPESDDQLFLLPGFDEYMLGYTYREPMVGGHGKYMPPLNGVFPATIVANGQIIGIWRRTIKTKEVIIEPTLFVTLTKRQKDQLYHVAKQYASYLSLPLRLVEQ